MIDDHPVSALANTGARVHFPIEGKTNWVTVMRAMIAGSVLTVAVVGAMLLLEGGMPHVPQIILGLFVFLGLEIAVVRKFIIPRMGDFGAFRITERRVEVFPLSPSGLAVSSRPHSFMPAEFSGVRVQAGEGFVVTLIHPDRAMNLRVRTFSNDNEARDFSIALADALGLKVIAG